MLYFQGWCSTNGISLTIPKSFLPAIKEGEISEPHIEPLKPEVEEPAVSSWCSKANIFLGRNIYQKWYIKELLRPNINLAKRIKLHPFYSSNIAF